MMPRSARYQALQRGFAFMRTPTTADPDQYGRGVVLNTLFLGTLGLIGIALLVVCVNYCFLGLSYLAPRIIAITFAAVIMVCLYLVRRRYYTLASYGLLAFYFIAATAAVWLWGVETPVGTLLFALVIIFSGILLGARFALYALCLTLCILTAAIGLVATGVSHPDISWAATPAGYYDVAVFAIILGNLALVSWLFNRSMERSLQRARRSERALRHQKQLLEVKVEERTRQAQAAHFERIQEMYRFAELGHMSIGLLHDVANYLSVLSLDIEDLKQTRRNRSVVIRRVQQSIRHLDNLISQVRSQIKNESSVTRFNISDEIDQVIKLLEYKTKAQKVTVLKRQATTQSALWYTGNLNHFWQMMTNLISNAVDAYDQQATAKRQILVVAERTARGIMITVTDYGVGIPTSKQQKIFEPFYSSKGGMGIGLAITKRMVEKSFGGAIYVTSTAKNGTTFNITLPDHEATTTVPHNQ